MDDVGLLLECHSKNPKNLEGKTLTHWAKGTQVLALKKTSGRTFGETVGGVAAAA